MNYQQLEIYELDQRQQDFALESTPPRWVEEGRDYKFGYCEEE